MSRILDFNDGFTTTTPSSAIGVVGADVSNVPSGNLAATTMQGAVNELQSDIDTRAPIATTVTLTGTQTLTNKTLTTPLGIVKGDVGLGNIDNTSDVNKPVSTAQAASIATKMTNPMTTAGDVIYGAASGAPTRLPNGTSGYVLQSAGGTSAPAWSAILPTVFVQDQRTAGTSCGGSIVTGNQTRVLNTTLVNTISGASLASNQVTLPAGTYLAWGIAPAYSTNGHRVRLVNATDTVNLILGTAEYSDAAGAAATSSVLHGVFTISGTKAIQLSHYTNRAQATNGLGNPVNDTFVEVYAQLLISRLF